MDPAKSSTAVVSTSTYDGMDEIDVRFMLSFNRENALHVNDHLAESVDATRDIPNDPACPRYHPIKCLVLLGSARGDWEEANACWKEANALCRITRSFHPVGQVVGVDKTLDELGAEIDELRVILDCLSRPTVASY